jgi:hypothetical protein
MTGAITTNSTFDGRDVSVDGAKLDTHVGENMSHMHEQLIDLRSSMTDYAGNVVTPDSNTFYPVYIPTISSSQERHVIYRQYSTGMATGVGVQGLYVDITTSGGSWGGNIMHTVLNFSEQSYYQAFGGVGWGNHGRGLMYFLRGGLSYKFFCSRAGSSPQIYLQQTKYYNHSNDIYDLTVGPITNLSLIPAAGAVGSAAQVTPRSMNNGQMGTVGGHAGA